MKKILASALVITSMSLASSAWAITVDLVPPAATVNVGQPLSVDIVASLGLDEIVAAYDFNISFDQSILSPTNVTFGSLLGGDPTFQGFTVSSGLLDVAEVSLLFDADLTTLQQPPSRFTLATVSFTPLALGISPLNFVNYGQPGIDIKGSDNTPYVQPTFGNASVTVTAIPLPASVLLLPSALAGIAMLKKRART
jgi:hypothetical protein